MSLKSRVVLTSVGTSIITNINRDLIKEISQYSWESNGKDIKKLEDELKSKLNQNNFNSEEFKTKISAEINSLNKMKLQKDDLIVLISTDTADGRISAELLKIIISNSLSISEDNIKIERVKKLNVLNSKEFREEGIKNLIELVNSYIEDKKYSYDIVINQTGGFKGVVPFLTMMAQIMGKKSVYIFERSNELIYLPPLPITLNYQFYERAKKAIDLIDEKSAISYEEYFSNILGYKSDEKEIFLSLTEEIDGLLTLSPLVYIFKVLDTDDFNVLVAPDVNKFYSKLNSGALSKSRLKDMICRVNNRLWRNNHYHSFTGTDLEVFKLNSTAERIAGFSKDDKFYVTNIYADHDEYEKDLPKQSKSIWLNQIESFEKFKDSCKDTEIVKEITQENETPMKIDYELQQRVNELQKREEKYQKEISDLKELQELALSESSNLEQSNRELKSKENQYLEEISLLKADKTKLLEENIALEKNFKDYDTLKEYFKKSIFEKIKISIINSLKKS